VLAALVTFAGGCAAEAEEQAGPQFPQPAIGAPGTPAEDLAEASRDIGQEPPRGETVVIGNDGAVPSDGAQTDEYADADPSALTDFHSTLDPYGTWVDDPRYGTIWQPSASAVGPDFAPYETNGYWSYGSDYVWVSNYSWGWAPFHYGRWVYATRGWGWIPGRTYAGAWTSWRTGYGPYAGYVGWAALPPTWIWRGGQPVGVGIVPPAAYGFMRGSELFAGSPQGRMVTGPTVGAIGTHTAPVAAMSSPGRTLAHPEVAGPTPASMNVQARSVPRPPANNAGLNHARQFSHPSTAVALGARAPAGWSGRAASPTSRSFASSSMGTSAYGRYAGLGGATRTLGGGGFDRSYVGGHALSGPRGGAAYGAPAGGGHFAGGYHGGGVHGGVAPAPQSHPQYYGGGYHPSGGGSFGGGGGGHFGGHGGGGRGGGHR
jgi:hypothetical protein